MRSDEEALRQKRARGDLSRRSFLTRAGAMSIAAATAASTPFVESAAADSTESQGKIPGTVPISLKVNGEVRKVNIDPRATVLDTLRETLHLTGTKKGCEHRQCGACTVHLNGERVNSCLLLARMHQDTEIVTIEGLGTPDNLHAMQAAFVSHDGYQCGYCTAGQIMSATTLLNERWGQSDLDVREGMSGNICRCGAYMNIVAAIQSCRH